MTHEQEWLTLEDAARQLKQPLSKFKLCVSSNSPESQFQRLGLLFDKTRHTSGEPCLQVLQPASKKVSEVRQATKADAIEPRSYAWSETPITVQIRWQPPNEKGDRQVLIAATTYDDFPLMAMVDAAELTELPPAIGQLLDALQQQLSVRQAQYQQGTTQSKPTSQSVQRSPTKPPTATTDDPPTPTQITFF